MSDLRNRPKRVDPRHLPCFHTPAAYNLAPLRGQHAHNYVMLLNLKPSRRQKPSSRPASFACWCVVRWCFLCWCPVSANHLRYRAFHRLDSCVSTAKRYSPCSRPVTFGVHRPGRHRCIRCTASSLTTSSPVTRTSQNHHTNAGHDEGDDVAFGEELDIALYRFDCADA